MHVGDQARALEGVLDAGAARGPDLDDLLHRVEAGAGDRERLLARGHVGRLTDDHREAADRDPGVHRLHLHQNLADPLAPQPLEDLDQLGRGHVGVDPPRRIELQDALVVRADLVFLAQIEVRLRTVRAAVDEHRQQLGGERFAHLVGLEAGDQAVEERHRVTLLELVEEPLRLVEDDLQIALVRREGIESALLGDRLGDDVVLGPEGSRHEPRDEAAEDHDHVHAHDYSSTTRPSRVAMTSLPSPTAARSSARRSSTPPGRIGPTPSPTLRPLGS